MKYWTLVFLAMLTPGALHAQAACPANVKAIPLRKMNQHQMVVGVMINHTGPYDFLIDTGTQMTVVDMTLAGDLHLIATGSANVAGVSLQGEAMYSRLDSLEIGDHAATNHGVMLYNMKKMQNAGFVLRGLLGEDFLSRYDVLIDKTQSIMCIDDTGVMLEGLRGSHVASASPGGGRSPSSGAAGH